MCQISGLIKDQDADRLMKLAKMFKDSAMVRILEGTCHKEEKKAFKKRFGVEALEYLSRNDAVDRQALASGGGSSQLGRA